jgi:hypothetical protein
MAWCAAALLEEEDGIEQAASVQDTTSNAQMRNMAAILGDHG